MSQTPNSKTIKETWVVVSVYGKKIDRVFTSKAKAKRWIYSTFTANTIVEDEIKPVRLFLDTPERLDRTLD